MGYSYPEQYDNRLYEKYQLASIEPPTVIRFQRCGNYIPVWTSQLFLRRKTEIALTWQYIVRTARRRNAARSLLLSPLTMQNEQSVFQMLGWWQISMGGPTCKFHWGLARSRVFHMMSMQNNEVNVFFSSSILWICNLIYTTTIVH